MSWVYKVNDDFFVRPQPPPSPDTLSWEPLFFHDNDGNVEFETEQLRHYFVKCPAAEMKSWLNDKDWSEVGRARQSVLFETPIAHFVRAFLAEPLDEFLAHITAIEAALGLESDSKKRGAAKRVVSRISALLGARADGDDYRSLFDLRSAYPHGRPMSAT